MSHTEYYCSVFVNHIHCCNLHLPDYLWYWASFHVFIVLSNKVCFAQSTASQNVTEIGVHPAACHWKAIKEARLAKSKVCFILDASNGEGGGAADAYLKPNSSHPPTAPPPHLIGAPDWLLTIRRQSFYRQREGATCRNSTVSSDSHLEIGHRWSDQGHLDCFRYSYSSLPVMVVFISLRPILRIVVAYVMRQSSRHVINLSTWGFSYL